MKTSTFAALAVVTAVAIGGAFYATQEREAVIAESFEKAPLYPDLLSRVNDVTWLRINSQSDGPLTMVKQDGIWVLEEKGGYYADIEKISQSLVELSSMETIEPKTKKPENFPELYVEDVEAPEGTITNSIHVTAKAGDETLADLLVGRDRPAEVGGGVFVRKAGENQTWLASGSYQPNRRAIQWLDRNIVNIDSRRVHRVTMQHADGDGFEVRRPDIAAENMAYGSFVPPGMEPKPPHEMNNMAQIVDFLVLEDVRLAAELDWSKPETIAWFETYDGLKVAVTAKKDGDHTWFRIVVEPGTVQDDVDSFVAEFKGEDSMKGRIADQMKTAEEAAAEIATLNERLAPWAFRFTEYKTGKAVERSADMLQAEGKDKS